jgi:hypothetical protein
MLEVHLFVLIMHTQMTYADFIKKIRELHQLGGDLELHLADR